MKINLYCWDKDSRGDKEMIDFADKGVYIVQLFSVLQAKNKKTHSIYKISCKFANRNAFRKKQNTYQNAFCRKHNKDMDELFERQDAMIKEVAIDGKRKE